MCGVLGQKMRGRAGYFFLMDTLSVKRDGVFFFEKVTFFGGRENGTGK